MLNKPKRNPTWSREELILALDLYFELGSGSRFSSANSQIIELSEMLNKLQVHSERPDEIKFRNPNGVSTEQFFTF
jgi:5-methylcytosine-specific restriction enzyme A